MDLAEQFVLAEQARRLAAQGRFRESASLLEPLVRTEKHEALRRSAAAVGPAAKGAGVRPEVLDLAARVHLQLGEMKAALDCWERACQMDPGNDAYRRSLRRCTEAMKPGFAGLPARNALSPILAVALVLCVAVGGWLGVRARNLRPALPTAVGGAVEPAPADALRDRSAQVMSVLPNAAGYEVVVDDACVVTVTGQARSLSERYEMEQALAALPGVSAVDVSGVGVAASCVVEPGDTLWSLAAHFLGSPYRWEEIAEVNGLKVPYAIRPGDRLKLP